MGSMIPIMGINKEISNSPKVGRKVSNMGLGGYSSLGLAESLFSKVQLRVIALLFSQPDREYLSAELIDLADSGVGAVRRVLKRLVKSGLVSEIYTGKRKLYKANKKSPIYEELHSLIMKTAGLSIPIRLALSHFSNNIKAAFIFGSIARGDDDSTSDVDLMIIGNDLDYTKVLSALNPVEKEIQRNINAQILTLEEWKVKLAEENSFLLHVISQPKIFLIGNDDDF